MHLFSRNRLLLTAILWILIVPAANAAPIGQIVGDVIDKFMGHDLSDTILDTAKTLFWSLATISLVWTMGALVVRQDIGEMLMELVRFVIVTGIFYWLLINASTYQGGHGFVDAIVRSFLQMPADDPSDDLIRTNANDMFSQGITVYIQVLMESGEGDEADRLIGTGMSVAIMVVCAIISAQFLFALVMAWFLGYAGIFLLGFGGSRWTAPIAINFYKHVVALGAVLLALGIVGTIGTNYLKQLRFEQGGVSGMDAGEYLYLGLMLATSILVLVLSVKVPQFLYTLVTGSTLGLYAGTASVAASAIANAGTSAYTHAMGRFPGGGGGSGGSGAGPQGRSAGGGASHRADSVMEAAQRSAAMAGGMADPFHVNSGADPFAVRRAPDPQPSGRTSDSVFGGTPVNLAPMSRVVDELSEIAPETVGGVTPAKAKGRTPAREASDTAKTGVSRDTASANGATHVDSVRRDDQTDADTSVSVENAERSRTQLPAGIDRPPIAPDRATTAAEDSPVECTRVERADEVVASARCDPGSVALTPSDAIEHEVSLSGSRIVSGATESVEVGTARFVVGDAGRTADASEAAGAAPIEPHAPDVTEAAREKGETGSPHRLGEGVDTSPSAGRFEVAPSVGTTAPEVSGAMPHTRYTSVERPDAGAAGTHRHIDSAASFLPMDAIERHTPIEEPTAHHEAATPIDTGSTKDVAGDARRMSRAHEATTTSDVPATARAGMPMTAEAASALSSSSVVQEDMNPVMPIDEGSDVVHTASANPAAPGTDAPGESAAEQNADGTERPGRPRKRRLRRYDDKLSLPTSMDTLPSDAPQSTDDATAQSKDPT